MAKIEQVTPARPVKVKLVNVAAYARVSTASERQLSSIATQVSYYSRLIQSTPAGPTLACSPMRESPALKPAAVKA